MNKANLQSGRIGYVTDVTEIPQNAIMVSHEQMTKLQKKVMNEWKPSREMFALKYGGWALGGCAALSGFVFSMGFRNLMILRRLPKTLLLAPSTCIPFVTTILGQESLVTNDVAMGITGCASCLGMRTCLIQVTAGLLQPLGLAISSASVMAKNYATYPLPNLSDYKTLLKVYSKMLQTMKQPIIVLALLNVSTAVLILQGQLKSISKVNERILENGSSAIL